VKEHAEVHQRAVAHAARVAPDLFEKTYVLYREDASGHHHGTAACGAAPRHPVELTVEEVLALADSESDAEECECGGWRSTSFFPALLIAHRNRELHQIDAQGGIEDVAEALEQIDRMQPWWRPDLENVGPGLAAAAALSRENYRLELDLLDRCTSFVDTRPLVRYLAAHGLRSENDVAGAREFSAWVDTLNPRAGRGDVVIRAPRGALGNARRERHRRRFEDELDRALSGRRVVALIERRLWSPADGATWHTPAEVLLLSLTGGQTARSDFAWLELPEVVVDGVRALTSAIPGPGRLGVLARDTLPPHAVREIAQTLWQDNDGTWSGIDDVLAVAAELADEHG